MDKLLDINPIEILFVLAIISILIFFLNKIFFKPIGGIIKEREIKVKSDSDILQNMVDQINDKTALIETELKKARREAGKLKEELIKEGESVKDMIIEETREKTKTLMLKKMSELENTLIDAEKALGKEINTFSEKIKEKFL